MGRSASIAQTYAPEGVANLLSVGASQQVMLSVRFAEVSRTLGRELSIQPMIAANDFLLVTIDDLVNNPFVQALTEFTIGDVAISVLLDALEAKGVVKTLAEPKDRQSKRLNS